MIHHGMTERRCSENAEKLVDDLTDAVKECGFIEAKEIQSPATVTRAFEAEFALLDHIGALERDLAAAREETAMVRGSLGVKLGELSEKLYQAEAAHAPAGAVKLIEAWSDWVLNSYVCCDATTSKYLRAVRQAFGLGDPPDGTESWDLHRLRLAAEEVLAALETERAERETTP